MIVVTLGDSNVRLTCGDGEGPGLAREQPDACSENTLEEYLRVVSPELGARRIEEWFACRPCAHPNSKRLKQQKRRIDRSLIPEENRGQSLGDSDRDPDVDTFAVAHPTAGDDVHPYVTISERSPSSLDVAAEHAAIWELNGALDETRRTCIRNFVRLQKTLAPQPPNIRTRPQVESE